MSQKHLGNIDPNTTSGTELALLLTQWGAGVDTSQSGNGRPNDISPGGLWLDTADPNNWVLKVAVSDGDIALLYMNPTTHTATFVGFTADGSGSSVPPARKVATAGSITGGGDLTADRQMNLINDCAPGTCPPNFYYGTTGAGDDRGFHPLPVAAGGSGGGGFSGGQVAVQRRIVAYPPGDYTFTVPANVQSVFVYVYGGGDSSGGAGRGASAMGGVPVAPGSTFTIHVGGIGDQSNINGSLVCGAGAGGFDGNAAGPAGWNVTIGAFLLANVGGPNSPGYVQVEYIGP